jgi:nucleoid-associated protein YgaU
MPGRLGPAFPERNSAPSANLCLIRNRVLFKGLNFWRKEAIRLISREIWNGTNMQNKTPILVFTGLAIVAAAAVAGLTRDRWMGETPPAATTTAEAPAATEQPVAPEPPKTAEQTAATEAPEATVEAATPEKTVAAPAAPEATQPAAQTPAAEAAKTPDATQPAAQVATAETTAEQPAATSTAEQPAPAAPAPETTQQVATAPAVEAQPEAAPAAPATTSVVPAFDTVRIEKTGEAVIAGTAAAGAEVALKLNAQEIARTTANDGGAFVIVLEKPLPAGSGALTLEAKAPGQASATTSAQSVAVIVPEGAKQEALVAVVSPDQPTKVLQKPTAPEPEPAAAPAPETQPESAAAPEAPAKPAKLVSIDAVDYDAAGNIVFSGQGAQGNTARIYIDNNFVGDAAVNVDGRWSFSGTADVAQGVHTLRVDGLDAKGEVVNRVEVPFFREAQSKVAEATQTPAAQSAAAPEASAPAPATGTTEAETAQPAAVAESSKTDAGTAAPAPPPEGRVVIQPGNNLWRISRVLYGTGAKFTVLYEANKEQIRNPDLIYPGQVFKTPDVAAKFETVDPKRREPLTPDENAAAGQ